MDPVGVVVPELRRDVDHLDIGYWKRDPLRSLGEGEMEAVEAGDVILLPPLVSFLVATRVGITTLFGVVGVGPLDDPSEVIDAVLEDSPDHPPP